VLPERRLTAAHSLRRWPRSTRSTIARKRVAGHAPRVQFMPAKTVGEKKLRANLACFLALFS